MAGETVKSEAICLKITPWSRTSHIVHWLTPHGKIATVVKGAVRPKSFFLGQYDLNYTCEIVYYLNGHGDLHPLRECYPLALREPLRSSFRLLLLADHSRRLVAELAPFGPDAKSWFSLLSSFLDTLSTKGTVPHDFAQSNNRTIEQSKSTGTVPEISMGTVPEISHRLMRMLIKFELKLLELSGLRPDIEAQSGTFALRGERKLPISFAAAQLLRAPDSATTAVALAEATRALGIFESFHLDQPLEPRRILITALSPNPYPPVSPRSAG